MPANATAASYKQLKEDFVSNLSGGSVSEIYYVTAVAPVRNPNPPIPRCGTGAAR